MKVKKANAKAKHAKKSAKKATAKAAKKTKSVKKVKDEKKLGHSMKKSFKKLLNRKV